MNTETATGSLHKRLLELLRASGRNTLRVSQIAAILGIDSADEATQGLLRELLISSRVVDYDAAAQTVRSVLKEPRDAEDEDEAALLALSDVDVASYHHHGNAHRHGYGGGSNNNNNNNSGGGGAAAARSHQRRSNSRHAPQHRLGGGGGGDGFRSDTGAVGAAAMMNHNSFTGMSRRRVPGGWAKPGQRGMEDAASSLGPVGRVGYVCVADELHLGKLEAYYRAQGYYTKFDFDVLHVRFAQPPSKSSIRVESNAAPPVAAGRHGEANAPQQETRERERERGQRERSSSADSKDGRSSPNSLAATDASASQRNYGSTRQVRTTGDGGESAASAGAAAAGAGAGTAATSSTSAATAGVKHGFELFVFPYGAVVWWGFDQRYFKIVESDYMLPNSAISHCMTNRYTTQLVNENYPVWCTYNLVRRDTLEVDEDFKARLRFDHFVIPYSRGEVATGSVLMLCASHALAQSAKIDYLELQVQELADSCSPLPRELREKGTVSITERRLLQLRGEVLSYRLMLKSGSDLLDEPDFFWENSYLKPVFQATKEEFEIAERVEALDNKLDAANEILSMLAEDFSQRHGARLEWIVIWLVFVEVVIGVLELLVDVRPWMHSK